jgi:hypothetical protein
LGEGFQIRRRRREDYSGELKGRVELLTGIEGTSSRKIVLITNPML